MRVNYTANIVAGLVHSTMDSKPGRIHRVRRVDDFVSIQVDFYQATRRHFLEQQAISVDQKMLIRARDPG
jgi:hypothetical protein